jgi:hypothetical protein
MYKASIIVLFTVLFQLTGTSLTAKDSVKIKRISGQIIFDGNPKDVAWESADIFPLTMHRPNFGSEPSEKSVVRLGFDDEYLWICASLYMHNPSGIYVASKKRDQRLFGQDAFGVILDTFNDNENGLAFYTTPAGLMTDYAISNDAVMNGIQGMTSIMNYSWNTFWDVKTTRDEKGWYVEMRIPFSSLKFKPSGDVATMGLIITRNISSKNEVNTYPAIKPDYGFLSPYKPSLSEKISFEGTKPKRPVYISPYLLGGFSRDYTLNETSTQYLKHDKPQYTAGLDLKYNVNSNLTLDLTANTDFAQVESDVLQVNLTQYALFYPEKRKFFQERTSLFDFTLGGMNDNLFYSRNIGLVNGNPVKIYGGARLTGRAGKWDLGFLNMETAAFDTVPGENFGVLRLRRQVINQNSYVGGMLTSRIGSDGSRNIAYGADGIFRLFGNDYLNVKLAQTYDSKVKSRQSSTDPSFFLADWERRSENGFAYKFGYTYIGKKFTPGSGFLLRNNVQGLSGKILYGWVPGNKSRLFSYNISLNAEQYNHIDDGKIESFKLFPMFEFVTKSGYFFTLAPQFQKEGVRDEFNLSDSIVIRAREYNFSSLQLMIGTPNSKKLSIMQSFNAGQIYDGKGVTSMSNIVFNVCSSFNISAMYTFNMIKFPSREINNKLILHTVNLTALVMFSTRLSASLMTQFDSSHNDLISNFRLRYNPREGNDFYFVVNDYRRTSDKVSVPRVPGYFSENVMVKFVHTFTL